jgi:hypothetical protein
MGVMALLEIRTRSGRSILIDRTGVEDRTGIVGRMSTEIELASLGLQDSFADALDVVDEVSDRIRGLKVEPADLELTLGLGFAPNGKTIITHGQESANFVIRARWVKS